MATRPLQVAVRIRPPQPHDGKAGAPAAEALDGLTLQAKEGSDSKQFAFDKVFGPEATQHEVYSFCALPLVDAVINGTNACIFAFGCTGAGKTHSMLGPEGGRKQAKQDGILPRAAAELFRRIARLEAEAKAAIGSGGFSAYEVRVSFLEVFCENAFDLLSGPVSASRDASGSCQLRETTDGRVYADGAKEEKIRSCEQLLDVVAQGAKARATAATGVHAHSSRSHALLVMSVEHRWRDVAETDPQKYRSQTARFTLVDLAGAESMERSHGGSVDAAGVGTNMGLLVLGRVIRALAEGSERVPYRDSTLTRLMQSSLGGKAETQMLACVSPAEIEAALTMQTLKYATSARSVILKPEAATVTTELETDPMLADVEDDDISLNRRCIWIETADFGDVFARCVGDPTDPLILYVHGSGPCNSSNFWSKLVIDVATLASAGTGEYPRSYFHVAIDCPGYGRSPGDRQSIRSYPGSLISNIVRALGRKTVACLVGSSQGACAALNCALECPKLMHTVAVCHPVGHAPHRYGAISQPTLLIFDTEDDGHPVSVGRQMRRHLPNPRYFEFTRSKDGDWECHHMGEEMISMLQESYQSWKNKRLGGRRDKDLPDLTRVAGGFNSWNSIHGVEFEPWGGYDAEDESAEDKTDISENSWRARLDPSTNTIVYENLLSGRISRVRPPGAQVVVERLGGSSEKKAATEAPCTPLEAQADKEDTPARADVGRALLPLFEGADENDDEDDEERQAREEKEAAAMLEMEASQSHCDLCRKLLVQPIRLQACRCALCGCCAEITVRYMRECPACGLPVDVKGGKPVSDVSAGLLAKVEALTSTGGPEIEEQQQLLQQLTDLRQSAQRIVLQYGNTSSGRGSKRSYTTFLKVASVDGSCPKEGCVAKVDFNINPGYSKPTSTAKEPSDKSLGFTFEYAMARAYPCHMTVHFKSDLGLPKLVIEHYVRDEAKTSRRVLLQLPHPRLPPAGAPRITEKEVVFDADPPQNAWLCFQAGRSVLNTSPQNFLGTVTGVAVPESAAVRSRSRTSSKASGGSGRGKG
ncbi:kif4 [Symbiodinium sp. CCMP2592]|nr:kif4 [Symbiodinium sp. CCMP2592]